VERTAKPSFVRPGAVLALTRVLAAVRDGARTKRGIAQGARDRIAFRYFARALPSNLAHVFRLRSRPGLTGAPASVEIAKAPPEGKHADGSLV
jgi:hypothetical protein